jgi:hypothetical protein
MAAMEAPPNPDLLKMWVSSIIAHPLAYTRHRLAHFSSAMFLDRPHDSDIGLHALGGEEAGDSQAPPTLQELHYLAPPAFYGILKTPAFWLATGVCLLVLLACASSPQCPAQREAALALVMSGLLYTCAYLVVGVATDPRYQFWSMVATFIALVISLPGLKVPSISLPRHSRPEP